MRFIPFLGRAGLSALLVWALFVGCGNDPVPSPFDDGAAGAAGEQPDSGSGDDGDASVDPSLGGPCTDEDQCDDGIECTIDWCDLEIGRCRFEPDHSVCADDVYCNGEELCVPGLGCRPGEPVSCTDFDPCTIDRCVEATRECTHSPRDADGDGDPVWNCAGGGDCDDDDPNVSSFAVERCGNQIDDDCDGEVDEDDCVRPAHDTCADALEVEGTGSYLLKPAGADDDYALSCENPKISKSFRDLVVALIVPEGDPVDVDLVARSRAGNLVLAAATQCGKASTETACTGTDTKNNEAPLARLKLRSLGPGAHAVYVASSTEEPITLDVRYTEPTPTPTNETCGTAAVLEPGEHALVSLVGVSHDVTSACEPNVGDLFYRFSLDEPSDVRLRAVSLDDFGRPILSLRGQTCEKDELTCRQGGAAELFARALPAGEHTVAVSATGPTDLDLVLEVAPASEPRPGEGCALPLELDGAEDVDFLRRPDAIQIGCLVGAPDVTWGLELTQSSDVLLIGRLSEGDEAALLLAEPSCASNSSVRVCRSSKTSPLRAVSHAVSPGSYRVVAESASGKPMRVEALLRPAKPATFVASSDECASAITIPPTGGRFEGNTANHYADYDASCDQGGGEPGGAPDQMLKLELERRQRVVLDLRESEFETLLSVRRGPDCPGAEVRLGCSAGTGPDKSFLDLTLEAGTYYVQIDGFDGASGRWVLEAFITDPS